MRRLDLLSDCASCAAVCCVAPTFEASEDFACAKPAGARCHHLTSGDRCDIHGEREARGFRGCVSFDCYGAGQRATRAFAGAAERERPFFALRELHELLFLLTEAVKLCPTEHSKLRARLVAQADELDAAAGSVASGRALEQPPFAARVHALLREVGAALGGARAPTLG